jgi:chemotaxis protein methyltransferase CheR
MQLESHHINFFKDYFLKKTAISLGDDKSYLIENRLLPVIKKYNYKSFDELILNLKTNNVAVVNECVDAISTNETYFFRDIKPFQIFEKEIIPNIVLNSNSDTINIWSAACSSGQEPYSIAISLLENRLALKGKKFKIIATDISKSILEKAKTGIYNNFEVQRGLPINLLIKYFDKVGDANWKIKDEVKKIIEFTDFNLLDDITNLGSFDCVFCRYVLIYFDEQNKKNIVEKIAKSLNNGGYFLMGTSETNNLCPDILNQYEQLRSVFVRKQILGS